MLRCALCVNSSRQQSQFDTIDDLETHIIDVHFNFAPYGCSYCTLTRFSTEYALKRHYNLVHNLRSFKVIYIHNTAFLSIRADIEVAIERSIQSSNCDSMAFTNVRESRKGFNEVGLRLRLDGERLIKCWECGEFTDARPSQQIEHANERHSHLPLYSCGLCNPAHGMSTFTSIANFDAHCSTVHLDGRFVLVSNLPNYSSNLSAKCAILFGGYPMVPYNPSSGVSLSAVEKEIPVECPVSPAQNGLSGSVHHHQSAMNRRKTRVTMIKQSPSCFFDNPTSSTSFVNGDVSEQSNGNANESESEASRQRSLRPSTASQRIQQSLYYKSGKNEETNDLKTLKQFAIFDKKNHDVLDREEAVDDRQGKVKCTRCKKWLKDCRPIVLYHINKHLELPMRRCVPCNEVFLYSSGNVTTHVRMFHNGDMSCIENRAKHFGQQLRQSVAEFFPASQFCVQRRQSGGVVKNLK